MSKTMASAAAIARAELGQAAPNSRRAFVLAVVLAAFEGKQSETPAMPVASVSE